MVSDWRFFVVVVCVVWVVVAAVALLGAGRVRR
jgi:hypothetical protein